MTGLIYADLCRLLGTTTWLLKSYNPFFHDDDDDDDTFIKVSKL